MLVFQCVVWYSPVLVAMSAQCRSLGLNSSCMGSGGSCGEAGAGGDRRARRAAGADGVRASGACVPAGGKLSLKRNTC